MTSTTRCILGLFVSALLVGGCTTKAEFIEGKEDQLAAAGFDVLPASNKARQQEIRGLPAHRFLSQIQGGKVIYLYGDPLVCNCLYVGSQQAYDRYRRSVLERELADEQQLAAEEWRGTTWDWGPWGPGWWIGP
jgi:hypothetical protein